MAGSMVGRTLNNRYEITERVGLGGMAEVYRAQDKVLGRMVAVKVMLPQYAADPTFTQRFRQEAASAAKLQSPYIVSIYDWGLDGETYYIVMEFIRGTDLKTAIQQRGAIQQRKVAEIGSQVAQALSVAHAGGIIHRDIKPQNIMIQPDGNIKVMDFGIARAGDAGLSQTATVLGTAHYVSPEQAQGKELTPASDIYSLGIVLYEACTGSLPFDGQDAVSVAVKQVNEIPAPPSTINPHIDPTLEAIIMKALEKDPTQRFQNASEMRSVLNDFLAGRPVALGGNLAGMETRAMGGVAAPGGKTKVMTNIPPMDASAEGTKHINYKQPEEAEEKKSKKGMIIGIIIAILAIAVIAGSAIALMGGQETVDVPNVTNMTVDDARKTLNDSGLKVGTQTEVYSAEVPAGKIVSTNPGAGEKAKKGDAIAVSVSKGSEKVSVPDLKGMTKEEAVKALQEVGLNAVEGDSIYSSDVDEGHVAEQGNKAGTSLNKGDSVEYHLSKGEENVDVPNVVGAHMEKGRESLEAAGFKVTTSYADSDKVSEGRIISQSNSGKAPKGSTIKIVVSNGPSEKDKDSGSDSESGSGSGSGSGSSSGSSSGSGSGSGSSNKTN